MKAEEHDQKDEAQHQGLQEDAAARSQPREHVAERAKQAARAVMHPDPSDPEWRYYHGAWHS